MIVTVAAWAFVAYIVAASLLIPGSAVVTGWRQRGETWRSWRTGIRAFVTGAAHWIGVIVLFQLGAGLVAILITLAAMAVRFLLGGGA